MPASSSIWEHQRRVEVIEKLPAGNLLCAEGDYMGRGLLAVHEAESPGLELADERDQRDFRGIGGSREHRFREKRSTDRDSIDPSDQVSLLPGFNRMGIPEFM